jgi:CheY-like chemotaxis protein
VRDTGVGIPTHKLPHVFEMFMQVESSMEVSHGGVGIGLTLVKKLVEMHDGEVIAASPGKGKGSSFTVRLPLIGPPQAEQPKMESITAPKTARKFRILLADDNESFAETFGYMLGLSGHDVKLARDGVSALDAARSFLPEVILLDIGLPGINGFDLCKKIRSMPLLEGSVLIAQTGFSQPEHRERSMAAGFDHYVVKPVKIDFIEELLASLNPNASEKAA